jgi:GntR family histidine utilization transcriptional repressor
MSIAVGSAEYLAQDFTTQTPYVYLMAAAPISEAEHVIDAVHATPPSASC